MNKTTSLADNETVIEFVSSKTVHDDAGEEEHSAAHSSSCS